ncbi:MAG: phenylalanine--tRNA ligase subunit beta [Bacillota bacterium]|nr:phenylalanine--tRNA ligase subunit beta [Bacillota bacterium]
MKTTMEWLREFVPINLDTKIIADEMTMTGSKVENTTTVGGLVTDITSGCITAIDRHPDADRLVICQVDIGARKLQIVTGATNISVQDKVPVAVDGAVLADGSVIRSGEIRGKLSDGMLCSVSELGFTVQDFPDATADGIYILPADTPVGQDIRTVLNLNDVVIDFEITSNRVDCFAVEGLAREAAVTFNLPFTPVRPVVLADHPQPASEQAAISIDAPDLCYRYCGRVVRDIRIGPSPAWLRRRLRGAGMRPINNLVDVTNYVMLELGQPMHAFDLEQLAGRSIHVRRARNGEIMRTLDSVDRRLDDTMLVIADDERAVALAGVMGAENSEVTTATRTVLLESATFNPIAVRQAARKVGLRTEASARFEKGLDVYNAERAVDRACELIEKIGAGRVCPGLIDAWPVRHAAVTVPFSTVGINAILGTELDESWLTGCLEKLSIPVRKTVTGLVADIPSWRPDLLCEVDLAEEAARIYGYNNIKPSLLSGKQTTLGGRTPAQKIREKIKDFMLAAGFFEACTYSFESPRQLDRLQAPADHLLRRQVRITNPLGEDYSCMRTSMLPSLLTVASTNWNRSVEMARVFETAFVYQPETLPVMDLPREVRHLTAFIYDTTAEADAGQLFFVLKGILDELLLHLGIRDVHYAPDTAPWLHPGRCAALLVNGQKIGQVGEVHPDVAQAFIVPPRTVLLDVELDLLVEAASEERQFQALPRYPAVTRDLALIVDRSVSAGQLSDIIREAGGSLLEQVNLFDVYQGRQVADGCKSMAYSLVFRAEDRTLSDEMIAPVMQEILAQLAKKAKARLRA